ncbi:MAG: hypothetical protein K6L81_17600 [Agarilytica sp.]
MPEVKHTYRTFRLWICSLACLLVVCGCSSDENAALSISDRALVVREAINSNNPSDLLSLFESKLVIREQEWESAPDGTGFTLGEVRDFSIDAQKDALTAIESFLGRVHIEGEKPFIDDVSVKLFSEELSGIESQWEALELVYFLRGMGDVEHIVLLGFDAETHKLRRFYIN